MGSIIIRYTFLKYHSEQSLSHRKSRVESGQLVMKVLQYLRERDDGLDKNGGDGREADGFKRYLRVSIQKIGDPVEEADEREEAV